MKNISDLKRAVAKLGATVEEDFGYRDMRALQLVAPSGKVWAGSDCQSEPVQWATGSSPNAIAHNEAAFRGVLETVSHGLRDMTEDEAELYATD